MTEKTQPTDAELDMLIDDVAGLDSSNEAFRKFARAVLAKWGQPAQAEEPVAYSIGNTLKWHEGKGLTNAQLFAAPQPVAREPLSHAQAKALVLKYGNDPLNLVFQVELAHGIKGGQHGTE